MSLAQTRPSARASLGLWGHARARIRRFEPATLIWVTAAASLVFLVVGPAVRLVLASIQDGGTGALTLHNYVVAYGQARGLLALGNTLLYAIGVVLLAATFAIPMAWGVARTDMPAKGLVRALVLGAFVTPPYLGAIAWILLAGPNAGWINRAWMALTGASEGFANIYSFGGLILVTALYSFPYIFIFTADALERVSSEMEEASHILGASSMRTITRITLPLVTPAILGGAIVVFLDTVALFGTPAIIALPARIKVMTLVLWQYFAFPVRTEVAAAYAIPLILITVALFAAQRTYLGRKGYVALTGKGGSRTPMQLGKWRWVMFGYAFMVLSMSVLLPYAALGQAAFSRAWGLGLSYGNLTIGNFRYLLVTDPAARQTILHTFAFAACAATFAVGLALLVAYVVSRRALRGAGILGFLCMAPIVIPGIVLAIGFYAAWAPPPLALYGTAAIVVFGFTARYLPVAYTSCLAGMRALNPEMEDAVRILGGGRLRAITRVVAPLLKTTLAGAWLLVFIPAARELSTAIFLVSAKTRVISVMMLDLSENGSFETLAALGFFLLGVTILIVLVGYRMLGRDFMLRRS